MDMPLKIWRGRWKPCQYSLHASQLIISQNGQPIITMNLSTMSIVAVLDDPLRVMLRSGTEMINLRTETTMKRIAFVRFLLQERERIIDRQIRKDSATSPLLKDLSAAQSHIGLCLDEMVVLLRNLMPYVMKDGIDTAHRLVQLTNKMKYGIDELILMKSVQFDDKPEPAFGDSNNGLNPQSASIRGSTGSIEQRVSKSPRPSKEIIDRQQSFRNILEAQQSFEEYQSFLEEGFDGMQKFDMLTADQHFRRNDSQRFEERNIAQIKKKLLSQNAVFQQLPNIFSHEMKRSRLPYVLPQENMNIIGLIKGVIGANLFTLNLPIQTNEPLTILQRLAEHMVHQDILIKANNQEDSSKRLLFLMTFVVAGYSSMSHRARLPLKPVVGETYELESENYRFVAQQVDTHTSAFHCESIHYILEGVLQHDISFAGKSIDITPKGNTYIYLKKPKHTVCFTRCPMTLKNIFFGVPRVSCQGDITINDERHDLGFIKLKDSSTIFDKDVGTEVDGWLKNSGAIRYMLQGRWDSYLDSSETRTRSKNRIWQYKLVEKHECYNFTDFTINLNNITHGMFDMLPPTDSRFRPDIRALQNGLLELAQEQRQRIYQKERVKKASSFPLWFEPKTNHNGQQDYKFNGRYWQEREQNSWHQTKDLF